MLKNKIKLCNVKSVTGIFSENLTRLKLGFALSMSHCDIAQDFLQGFQSSFPFGELESHEYPLTVKLEKKE